LELAAKYDGRIDLLLSDVQMPGMTGPDLGETLKQSRPEIHVMFMSGFTGGNLLVLNYGMGVHREAVRVGEVVRDDQRCSPYAR